MAYHSLQQRPLPPLSSDGGSERHRADGIRGLLGLRGTIKWYIVVVLGYAVVTLGVASWILTLPESSPGIRALPDSRLPVDSVYSGLLLSIFLIPAAMAIRKTASELERYHPFAIASKRHIALHDLDRLAEGGLSAVWTLFKYDRVTAFIQAFLIATGAVLVPLGTLLVFIGQFSSADVGSALVGMPVQTGGPGQLSFEQGLHSDDNDPTPDLPGGVTGLFSDIIDEVVSSPDSFLKLGKDSFAGDLVSGAGVLPKTDQGLGPTANANLTYLEGVRYDGVVTFDWKSGCQYSNEGTMRAGDSLVAEAILTIANGTEFNISLIPDTSIFHIVDKDKKVKTLWALIGTNNGTKNVDAALASGAIHDLPGKTEPSWYSLIECQPSLKWKLSNCLFSGSKMTDCRDAPDAASGVKLDKAGLDTLDDYMTVAPFIIRNTSDAFGFFSQIDAALLYNPLRTTVSGHNDDFYQKAPKLEDYDRIYGRIAHAFANVMNSGYYGVVEVPTEGSTPRPAYQTRVSVLGALLILFILCPSLATLVLLLNVVQRKTLRPVSLLAIANAVRGPGWDETLRDGGCFPEDRLRARYKDVTVAYQANPAYNGYAGLVETNSGFKQYS